MSKKNTKRALLSSVLALVLCFAMLTGTTFAWFTDSVTSGKNQIVAGNLDVELVHTNAAGTTEDVQGNTNLFLDKEGKPIKWEPGVMAWEKFTVQNVGNLALKYQLSINFTNEVKVDGHGLSEVLKVAVLNVEPTRENIESATLMDMADFLLSENNALAAGGEESFYVAIYWKPTNHDNDYNMNNGNQGKTLSIDLGISLKATQQTAENDSFDNQYDKDAAISVATAEELMIALRAGGNIALANDLVVPDGVDVTKDTVLYLNNHSLTATGERAYLIEVSGDADLTIIGGKLISESTNQMLNGTGSSTGASSCVYFLSTGKLTMTDVEVQGSVRGGHRAVDIYYGTAELNNVTMDCNYGTGVNAGTDSTVVLNDCDITVNGMYSAPYNSTCFSVFGGGTMTINGGNYTLINDDVYATGASHGGWVGIVMNSGGDLIISDGLFTNVPAAGFMPQYERAIIEVESKDPAVSSLYIFGGTFDPQEDQVYGGYGDKYYPNYYCNLVDNGDGTWTAVEPQGVLDDIIADAKDGDTITLPAGNYTIDNANNTNLTISGTKDTVVAVENESIQEGCDYGFRGSHVVFEGVTITTTGNTYSGYAGMTAVYNNCVINNTYTLYGDSEFNNCTFNVSGDSYCIWTWGATNVTFNNCTFNTSGKAILLYGGANTNLTVNGCIFNDDDAYADVNNKAAIEIGDDYGKNFTLTVNDTVVNGFDITTKGLSTGTTLWGNKNSMPTSRLNVVIDGVDVY